MRTLFRLIAAFVLTISGLGMVESAHAAATTSGADAPVRPPTWLPAAVGDSGVVIWRTKDSSIPQVAAWSGSAFSGKQATADVGEWRIIAGAASHTRDEYIVLGVDIDGDITGMICSAGTWSALPFNPLATVTETFWWGVDVAYETASGDAVVVWNRGTGGATALSYRVWNGTAWSAETPIATSITDEPQHLRLATNPNIDEMVLVASTTTSQDYAMVWDGSSWGNSNTLTGTSTGDDETDIFAAYESQSGRAMVCYGDQSTRVYHYIWDGSSWSTVDSVITAAGLTGDVRWTTLASDPQSDRIALGVLTGNSEIWLNVWDGSSWGTSLAASTTANGTVFPAVAVAFETQSGEALAVYSDGDPGGYRTWTAGGGWTAEVPLTDVGGPPNSVMLDPCPTADDIMLTVLDDDSDVNCVPWNGASWDARDEQDNEAVEVKNQPFIFLWKIPWLTHDTVIPGGWLATGYYEGDGIGGHQITGIGFSPDVVIIKGNSTEPAVVRTSTMSGDVAKELGTGDAIKPSVITSLDADGFTLTSDQHVNQQNVAYHWTAMRAFPGVMEVGSYIGNSDLDNRSIDSVGFQPAYVIVMSEDGEHAMQRFVAQAVDKSNEFGSSGEKTDRIQDFEPDGFQIGKHNTVNKTGITNHFVAFADVPGVTATMSYIGDALDDHDIHDAGFQPASLIIKREDTEAAEYRPASLLGDGSLPIDDLVQGEGIQTFLPDGFQVGTDNRVNDGGKTYYWVAFRDLQNMAPVLAPIGSQSVDEGQNLNVSVEATDPDSDSLILSAENIPANATYTDNFDGTGTFGFNPDFTQSGVYSVRFIVSDGSLADTETVAITVNNVNRFPVLAAIGAKSLDESQNLNFGVSASDPDSDSLILSAENVPANATFTDNFDGTGTFDFNPDFTQSGSYSVRFIASDGALADTEIVAITVSNVNRDPVLAAIGAKSVDENQNLNFGVSASDVDSDSLILTAENVPANATFTDNYDGTGTFDFNPDFTQAGSYSVRFIASDGSLADTEIVAITVNDANRDPVLAAIGAKSVDENQNLNFGVSAIDPDSDSLVLSAENIPANATFTDNFDGTGTFDFNPDFTQSGVYNVRFIVFDGSLADTEIVAVTVNNVNRYPVLAPIGAQSVDENQNLNFGVSATDPDSDSLILSAENLPVNATFTDNFDGTAAFDFNPDFTQSGVYNVRFIAADVSLADTEIVAITVNHVNRAPVLAAIGSQSVDENQNLNVGVSASDPDSDSLILSAENLPANATFTDNFDGTGTFDFNPDFTQAGVYNLRFITTDGTLADSEIVVITVSGVNRSPVLTAIGAQSVDENQNLNIGVSATDPDSDSLILSAENLPANATFTDNFDGTGAFDFNPDFSQSGAYNVRFIASDGSFADTEIVAITVNHVNRDPVLTLINDKLVAEGQNLNLGVSASDPDGDSLILSAENVPANATFTDYYDGTGTFDFNPDFTQVGVYVVTFIATDGLLADSQDVTIDVANTNLPPAWSAIGAQSVAEGQNLNVGVAASDPEGMIPTLTALNVPANATFTDNFDGTGTFDFNPDFTQSGVYNVTFIATDGSLADTEIVAITVDHVNLAPVLALISAQSVSESESLTFAVLATDPDGDSLILKAEDLPTNATFADSYDGTGSFDFNPVCDQDSTYDVRFIAGDGTLADTLIVTITVDPFPVARIAVTPAADTLVEGASAAFTVTGYSADLSCTVDLTDSVTWSTTDPSGGITSGGLYTAGNDLSPPDYYVRTAYGGLTDSGTVTVITDGLLHHVRIEWPDGTEFSDTTLTTDNDSVPPVCRSYDSGDNLISDAAVTWSVIGADAIGTVNAGPVAQTQLTLTSAGTGRIVARHSATIADTSGLITCIAGTPAYIVIAPDTGTVTTDATIQFSVDTYDADGNPAAAVAIGAWGVLGDIGGISPAGLFTPSTTGVGRITATGSGLADTTGTVTVRAGLVQTITALPDSAVVSADSSVQYTVVAIDGKGNTADPGTITWSLTEAVGTIDAAGLFDATTVGDARVSAVSNLGPTDTTAHLRVIAGQLATLEVSPDSVETTVGESRIFTVTGSDADGNAVEFDNTTWTVVGDVGTIAAGGVFTATTTGIGRITATSVADDVTDTNRAVVVDPTDLARLVVSPDTGSVTVGSSLGFIATGYTQTFEVVDPGKLVWEVLGGIGTIDAEGHFAATHRGTGRIAATRAVDGVSDTSRMIVVDILTVENIPLGDQFVHAGQANVPILAFTLENHFATAKGIVGLTLHDVSTGFGTPSQIRSSIDSVLIYIDSDADGTVGPSDVRLAAVIPTDESIDLNFGAVTVNPFSQRQLLAVVDISDQACDGDSLDVFLRPAVDIRTSDGSIVGGADSLNSLGFDIIDGLVGDQVGLYAPATTTVTSGGGFQHVLSLDLPRNGYREDTLRILALANAGSATEEDLDSVAVFLDDGDGIWDDVDRTLFAGAMLFTGGQWEISGVAIRLIPPATVFHVAAVPSPYATGGRTLALGVPLHGVEMFSANDGPIDTPIPAVATLTIVTSGAVEVGVVPIGGRTLTPGEHSEPILGLSLVNNSGTAADLDSLHLTLVATDPNSATQAQLDSQIDSVMLWLKRDADFSTLDSDDSLIAVSTVSAGKAAFDLRTLRIAANGGQVGVTATVALSRMNSKNGNQIGLRLDAANSLFFRGAVLITGDFPLVNTGAFTIDAFPAAAVTVHAMAGRTLFSGQNDQAVLDLELPRNGYSGDYLSRLRLINRGTSAGKEALARVTLWEDTGDDGFTGDDTRIGDLIHLDDGWEVSGLAHPLTGPTTRFFITLDVSEASFEGGTLQLALPVGGVTFASGTSGPDDIAVIDAATYLIFPASRITAISIPQLHAAIAPGTVGNALMTFALYNGYVDVGKTLQGLILTNRSHSRSATAFADREIGQISLFADTNRSRVLDNDLLLASGHLSDGALRLTGLTVELPPESLSYFFVAADVAIDAIDGDSLAVCIDNYADLVFNEAVNINGDVPISGTGVLIVDGSVSAQYSLTADPPAVLSPGDSAVVLLGFTPAVNGDLEDTLETITVTDVVAAGGSVIASLSLWQDVDGDDALGSADERLGTFAFQSGTWVVDDLSLPIVSPAPGLMVVATIASAAEAGASVQLAIPVLGCRYTSDNDGPRDHELVSPAASVISTAALRVAMPDLNATYTVGQSIEVPVAVTNASLMAIDNVAPAVVTVPGDTCVTLDSAGTSGRTIAPGETEIFGHFYTAAYPGSVAWSLRAASTTTGDSSVVLQTPVVAVQSRPDHAHVRLINSMPPAVTCGQANVFPMTIAIDHPDTAATAAPLRLDSLVIHAWDAAAQDLPFNSVAARLALATGLPNLTVLEQVPAEASVSLVFPQPLLVAPGRQRLLSLLVDIPEDAALVGFRLGLADADAVPLTDANTLVPVLLDPETVFPMQTAGCDIHDAAQRLAVSSRSLVASTLNYGQCDVAVLQLNVRHPADVGSSRIQISSVACEFVDSEGAVIPPSGLLDAVQILRGSFVLGAATDVPVDSQRVHVALSSPLVLNADETDSMRVLVSLKDPSAASGFSVIIRDSTAFTVRDISSGTLLETVSDPTALPLGAVFPMVSDFALLKQPASELEACFASAIPTAIVGGQDSIALFVMTCTYPASEGHSAVNIRSLRVAVQDSADVRLDPRALLHRVGYRVSDGAITYQSFLSLHQGRAVFEFGAGGIRLDPESSVTIELIGDIEADSPYDHFVLAVDDRDAVVLSDVSDSTRVPGMLAAAACEGWPPVYSPVVSLFLPAGEPIIAPSSGRVRVAYGGEEDVTIFTAPIDYDPPTRQGNVILHSLRADLRARTSDGDSTLPVIAVFDELRVLIDDVEFGTHDALATDGIEFLLSDGCVLRHGTHHTLTIVGDVSTDAPFGNYFLRFEDASFVGMIDEQLRTAVVPILEGTAYPFTSPDLSISTAGLGGSFSNYPNPFNPARGEMTTIAYVLDRDATVDIEIFTITGQRVITIADGAPRTAGAHQVDTWTGLNDASLMVVPGTYFCRITARYASGSVAQYRRKIAVVR